MPLNLASLVQTGSQALATHERRKKEAEDRKARQELEILQRSLLDEQIKRLRNPPAPEPPRPFTLGPGQGLYGPDGALIVERPDRPVVPRAPAAPRAPRPASADQAKLGSFGTRMFEAHTQLTNLERAHPGIGQRVDIGVRRGVSAAERLPGVGGAAARFIEPALVARLRPEEQAYYAALQELINARARRESGANIPIHEYDREGRPLIPSAGEDESVVPAKQARRLQAARLYIRQAGSAFDPELLSPEARAIWDSLEAAGVTAPGTPPPIPSAPAPIPGVNRFWRPQ